MAVITNTIATGAPNAELENKSVRSTRFATISSGTSGTITAPESSTIIINDFGGTNDAVTSKISGGKPTFETPQDSSFNLISVSFDTLGNWSLSSAPANYPIAIIYRVTQKLKDFVGTDPDIVGGVDFDTGPEVVLNANIDGGLSSSQYGGTIPIDGGTSASF
jgi:hypothetical protein